MGGSLLPDSLTSKHPCFHAGAGGRYGRIHLPVAPDCNIQCAYCNRKYDCVNESRPGVTGRVLEPEEAASYLEDALARMPFISVVGIAGPGDPFCDPERTLATLHCVRRKHPELHLCLSSNGLNIRPYINDLVELGVDFATITVNAVDPEIGQRIYCHVRKEGAVLKGREASGLLIDRQLDAISLLKAGGLTVKVNTVVVPGVNDVHVAAIAQRVSRLKVDLMNLIGLIPVAGTPLENTVPPSPSAMTTLRDAAEKFVPQMRHCVRCRADAAGLLHEDRSCPGFRPKMDTTPCKANGCPSGKQHL